MKKRSPLPALQHVLTHCRIRQGGRFYMFIYIYLFIHDVFLFLLLYISCGTVWCDLTESDAASPFLCFSPIRQIMPICVERLRERKRKCHAAAAICWRLQCRLRLLFYIITIAGERAVLLFLYYEWRLVFHSFLVLLFPPSVCLTISFTLVRSLHVSFASFSICCVYNTRLLCVIGI